MTGAAVSRVNALKRAGWTSLLLMPFYEMDHARCLNVAHTSAHDDQAAGPSKDTHQGLTQSHEDVNSGICCEEYVEWLLCGSSTQ